jgi:altronate dehydratase large subunit
MIRGFRRPDGSAGLRNHLLVIPTVGCANQVCARIAAQADGGVAIPHQHGCSQVGSDAEQTFRTLAGMGRNPNVGAALVVSLGCEVVSGEAVTEAIAAAGKPVVFLRIQEVGGSVRTIERGAAEAQRLAAVLRRQKPEPLALSDLVVAVKGGRPDGTIAAANLAIGEALDAVLEAGGTALAGETALLAAGAASLRPRLADPAGLDRMLERYEGGLPLLQGGPALSGGAASPDAVQAGGRPGAPAAAEDGATALLRAGSRAVRGTLRYGERPVGTGLWLMDTPLSDPEALSGFAAGGANIVLFATGAGTPVGSPILPVVKVTANPETARLWADNVDTDLSAGGSAMAALLAAAAGEWTKAEILGHDEFAITRVGLSL